MAITSPWLYALTVGPLGFYLWLLAAWHYGRHPRVVPGLVDHTLLTLAIGGLLVFGPFGQLVAHWVFARPDLLDWLAMASTFGLASCLLARRALHRVVVYHVRPEQLRDALARVLEALPGSYVSTMHGFEDQASGRGIRVESSRWLHSGVVEAYGREPEPLMQAIRPRLRAELSRVSTGPSAVALVLYGLSILVMLAPLALSLASHSNARAFVRAWFDRLTGR